MAREMKDSGIAWIGEIPSHWKVVPFKSFYSLGKGLTITKADLVEKGVPVISYGQIHSKENNGTSIKDELIRFVPESYLVNNQNCLVNWGDVIFADTSEDLDGCGNCVYVDREMTLFAGYHTIIATNHSEYRNKYFSYLFKTDCWRLQIRNSVNGVKLYSVPQRILSSTSIIVPLINEQRAIADYLDRKCEEIDELISLQEKIIEELMAYKQSVITEAVTKGLNPNARLVPSGIDWIGDVPEGWKVCRIKDMVNLQSGTNLTSTEFSDSGIYPVYGGNGLRGYYEDYSNDGEYILIGRQGALCGNINYASGKFWATEHAVVCYPKRAFARIWLGELLRAMNLKQYSLSSAQPGLTVERIKNLKMPLPPITEQQTISSYLNTKYSEIDALIALKQQKIETLKDYKKSIIYEYVTGKIEIA